MNDLRKALQDIADMAAPLPPECFNVTVLSQSRTIIFDIADKALSQLALVTCWNCPQALLPSWRHCHMCGAKQRMKGETPESIHAAIAAKRKQRD